MFSPSRFSTVLCKSSASSPDLPNFNLTQSSRPLMSSSTSSPPPPPSVLWLRKQEIGKGVPVSVSTGSVSSVSKRKRPATSSIPTASACCFPVDLPGRMGTLDKVEVEGEEYSVSCKRGRRTSMEVEDLYSAEVDPKQKNSPIFEYKMGRSIQPLELIQKEKSRQLKFKNRSMGLKKKIYELSTLCGVDACLIIYDCKSDDRSTKPVFWPSNSSEVKSILNRYKEHSRKEKGLRSQDLSEVLERTKKTQKKSSKLSHQDADQSKYPLWDDRLNELSLDQFRELVSTLDNKIGLIKFKSELLKIYEELLEEPPLVNPNCPITGVPLTQNLPSQLDAMMAMMMNDDDFTQFSGTSSSSGHHNTPFQGGTFWYDPVSSIFSNPGSSTIFF